MKKISLLLSVFLFMGLASCGHRESNLCSNEYDCASTWCKDKKDYNSCMNKLDDRYTSCQIVVDEFWHRNSKCTDLYNELYDCVIKYSYCGEALDVYINRVHSIEINECNHQYWTLLNECSGL